MSLSPEELSELADEVIKKLYALDVTFELTHPEAKMPKRATENSAAYDAFACLTGDPIEVYERLKETPTKRLPSPEGLVLYPGERAKIPLGIKFHLPEGWQGNLMARSGGAWNKDLGLANSVGLIDGDYPDEYMALVKNSGTLPIYIKPGEKIVQINFQRFGVANFIQGAVTQTTSRKGGLGHTGR